MPCHHRLLAEVARITESSLDQYEPSSRSYGSSFTIMVMQLCLQCACLPGVSSNANFFQEKRCTFIASGSSRLEWYGISIEDSASSFYDTKINKKNLLQVDLKMNEKVHWLFDRKIWLLGSIYLLPYQIKRPMIPISLHHPSQGIFETPGSPEQIFVEHQRSAQQRYWYRYSSFQQSCSE